jgi:hypothetical protein
VPAERGGLRRGRLAAQRRAVDAGGFGRRKRVGADVLVAVVGGDGAVRDEVAPAHLERPYVAVVGGGVGVGDLAEVRDGVSPAGLGGLEVAVGPERRDHAPRPRRVGGERGVRRQVVARVVGGREHRDPEPLEERARPVRVLGEPVRDVVVDRVRRVRGRTLRDLEDLSQLRLQPEAHRRAAVHVPVRAQQSPHLARAVLGERTLADAERVEADARRMQQPRHVVIGRHEQRRWIRERLVVEQQLRGHVTVRRDHRQVANGLVEPARDLARARVGRQQPVGVQRQHGIFGGHSRIVLHGAAPVPSRRSEPEGS